MSESIINSPVVHSAALTLPSLPVYCCFSTGSHHTLLQRLASNPPGGQQTRSDCRPSVCHSVQPYRKLLVGGQEIVCLVLLAEPLGCSKKKKKLHFDSRIISFIFWCSDKSIFCCLLEAEKLGCNCLGWAHSDVAAYFTDESGNRVMFLWPNCELGIIFLSYIFKVCFRYLN